MSEPILALLQILTMICIECACPSVTGAIACAYSRYRYGQVRDHAYVTVYIIFGCQYMYRLLLTLTDCRLFVTRTAHTLNIGYVPK
jgi:hypothetical protein